MLTPYCISPARRSQARATNIESPPVRLHDLVQRAITAGAVLTAACLAGRAIDDAQYARIDHAAGAARHELLGCLKQDFGIDEIMANQLGALL